MTDAPSLKILLVAAAVLVDHERRFLIAQRPSSKSFSGMWEFPGGKIEANETPEMALARDIREEIGLSVDLLDLEPLTFASTSQGKRLPHLLMPVYLCRRWQGTPVLLEHAALAWISKDEVENYNLLDSNTPLIKMVCAAL